jgi:hypothetical protein
MKTIILSIGLIVASLGMYAQNATLALKLNKGDKFALAQTSKMNVLTEFQGQEVKIDINSSTGQLIEVLDASNGNYTLSVVNDGSIGKMSMMGNDMDFNTTKGEGFDMMGGVPAYMKSAAGFKYELVVNSKGELVSAKGFDKLKKASEQEMGGLRMMGGDAIANITDSGMIKLTLSAFNYANKGTVKVGDNWSESFVKDKNNLSFKSDITAISASDITIAKAGKNKTSGKNSSPMGEVEVSSDVDSKCTITVNAVTGISQVCKVTENTKSVALMSGMEIPSTIVTDIETTVVKK